MHTLEFSRTARLPRARGLPIITQYSVPAPTGPLASASTREEAKDGVAGAAITVLSKPYTNPNKRNSNTSTSTSLALGALIDSTFRSHANDNNLNVRSRRYVFGVDVAKAILGEAGNQAER